MPVNGKSLAAIGAGSVLLYSGAKGYSILKATQNIVQGKSPNAGQTTSLLNTPTGSGGNSGAATLSVTATPSAIANAIQKYQGHAYLFGGAPGPNGANPWDCSSCASFVLGHDVGLDIPGGQWATVTNNGNTHGPSTIKYLSWDGAETVGHNGKHCPSGRPLRLADAYGYRTWT